MTQPDYHSTLQELLQELHDDSTQPDVRRSYRVMMSVLRRGVEPFTQHTHLQHPSLSAKLHYLLSERRAPSVLRHRINDARQRMRQAAVLPPTELTLHRSTDRQALEEALQLFYGAAPAAPAVNGGEGDPARLSLPLRGGGVSGSAADGGGLSCSLRLSLLSFTPTTLTGRTDDGSVVTCDYSSANPYLYDRDWSYLTKLLRPGAQLNIVRPHVREGNPHVLPELFIVEPDLLMDITAVAGCIESYAESPLVHLLNRLAPNETTAPILLGNLASQLLDEALHGQRRPYVESAREFLRHNALLLATTDLPADFHAEAQRQADNIRHAVDEGLGQHLSGFRRDDVVLEPTFFCEPLGLQGRMDMLQLDGHILVEQKSGKGGWPPPPDPEQPVQQQKHYAQMLLYMAVLHYGLGIPNDQIAPFLLYSKYPKGLLNLGPAPQLLHLALRLRNQMARCEQIYAEEGYGVLLSLTPERLRLKPGSDKLWQQYKLPQLRALLRPISEASPLEQAYYLRYLRFVSTEHLLSKVGNGQKDGSGFSAKWQCSLDEKRVAGNILDGLRLLSPSSPDERDIEEVVLSLAQPTEDYLGSSGAQAPNFRRGDIVVLYPYEEGAEPDVRRTPCLRGSVAELTTESVTIRLRAPQSTAAFFCAPQSAAALSCAPPLKEGQSWAIEHDFYEASSAGLFRGLHAFLSAPRERRDLLLCQRRPRVDESLRLRGEYGAFDDLALRVRQAQDLFLIIGPPGTGKTSFGLMTTLQEELLTPQSSVLILSYTNRAVDEACSKLVEAGIDFVRIGGSLSCSEECRPHLLEERTAMLGNADEVRQLIADTRVFAATTAALCGHLELFRLKEFSLAIIDEASQILEPQLLPLLSAQTSDERPAIAKIVMIGDHKQLPAVVQQSEQEAAVTSPQLQTIGLRDCRSSLFERLLRTYRDDPSVVYMLTRQGRMHPRVASFPNQAFYAGRLTDAGRPHQQEKGGGARVHFVDVPTPAGSPSDKVNLAEASVIAQQVSRYLNQGYGIAEIGIIVPYRNQIAAVRRALSEQAGVADAELSRMVIDTVERLQGSQRRVIIYGVTIQRRYQLQFLTSHTFEEDGQLIDRKLNVAMTRAMDHLVIVGNAALLRHSPVYSALLDSLE